MNIEATLKESIEGHLVTSLTDSVGHIRTVEPYIIYEDQKGEKMLGYYFLNGFDEQGSSPEAHWDTIKLEELQVAEMRKDHFDKRSDFDPFSPKYGAVIEFLE